MLEIHDSTFLAALDDRRGGRAPFRAAFLMRQQLLQIRRSGLDNGDAQEVSHDVEGLRAGQGALLLLLGLHVLFEWPYKDQVKRGHTLIEYSPIQRFEFVRS